MSWTIALDSNERPCILPSRINHVLIDVARKRRQLWQFRTTRRSTAGAARGAGTQGATTTAWTFAGSWRRRTSEPKKSNFREKGNPQFSSIVYLHFEFKTMKLSNV